MSDSRKMTGFESDCFGIFYGFHNQTSQIRDGALLESNGTVFVDYVDQLRHILKNKMLKALPEHSKVIDEVLE